MANIGPLPQWHNDVTLEFIEHYSKERCMWDPTHPDYKNRAELNSAWERLQAAMGPEHSINDLKRKKESIMTTFRSHVRRKKRNPKYTPAWFCYQPIESFLGEIYFGDGEELLSKLESDNDELYPYLAKRVSSSPMKRPRTVTKISSATPNRLQIKREIQTSPVTYNATSITEMDECELYGQLLAKKLRRLDQHQRDIAMHEIDNIVFNAKLYQHRKYDLEAQMKSKSPVFIEALEKQNEEHYDAEYLEDPIQE